MRSRIKHAVLSLGFAALLVATPALADGHCCREVASTRLLPVDQAATPRLRGRAVILDCFGVISMLNVIVSSPDPDGTAYAPAITGIEPILGDFFATQNHRGEGYILDVSLPTVQGRTVSVFDQNFTEVLSGTF